MTNYCSSGLTFGPFTCNKIIVTEVEVSKPQKNLILLLVCLLVISIASFEKHKFITKAVSISINYTSYVI